MFLGESEVATTYNGGYSCRHCPTAYLVVNGLWPQPIPIIINKNQVT